MTLHSSIHFQSALQRSPIYYFTVQVFNFTPYGYHFISFNGYFVLILSHLSSDIQGSPTHYYIDIRHCLVKTYHQLGYGVHMLHLKGEPHHYVRMYVVKYFWIVFYVVTVLDEFM